jgi:8-oxo-dGTP pyrophosphatase MutT (NUDIX family)
MSRNGSKTAPAPEPDWVRRDPLFHSLRKRLSQRPPHRRAMPDFVQAAVLLTLWRQQDLPQLLFIQRSREVRHHAGEISFPGGAVETTDRDLLQTAMRETHEEVGIPPKHLFLLGPLDQTFSFSRYAVFPFLGALPTAPELKLNSKEVAEAIVLPLGRLLNPDRAWTTARTLDGQEVTVYYYEVEGRVIWGATARILKNLLDLIRSNPSLLEEASQDGESTCDVL